MPKKSNSNPRGAGRKPSKHKLISMQLKVPVHVRTMFREIVSYYHEKKPVHGARVFAKMVEEEHKKIFAPED